MGQRLVIKSASELERGMDIYVRSNPEPYNRLTVVRLTKNTIQVRDWRGETRFIQKGKGDSERNFSVFEPATPTADKEED
jgi:hypothetical protein